MLARDSIMTVEKQGSSETEGSRRLTGDSDDKHPDPEVRVRAKRRYHTKAYKLKVLQKVSELKVQGTGTLGAYLRGAGLYYSYVRKWQEQLDSGVLTTKRGKKEKDRDALKQEISKLKRKLEHTEKKLKKTELIVELQKKISEIMGIETEKDI